MILIQRFSDADTVSEQQPIDELDFKEVGMLYIVHWLMMPGTYDVRLKRFWNDKADYVKQMEGG